MKSLNLPHAPPILFAKEILSLQESSARVKIEFEEIPTLGMLIEAAAQSSAAISDEEQRTKMGFLVSLKNIKLLTPPQRKTLEVQVSNEHTMENMKMMNFLIYEDKTQIAEGSFMIALQN